MMADAEDARQKEEARKARIEAGTAAVDENFAQFDDGFFNDYRDTQMDYFRPQVDKQFGQARDDLTYAFARNGTLNSSMAGQKQADLTTSYNDNLGSILSQATSAADGLKSNINSEKSSLIAQLNATGNADRVSNEALSRSQQIFQKQPSYNPLGDLFGGVTKGVGAVKYGNDQRAALDTYYGTGSAGSAGNSRIVN
jgi:hypothetical protein